MTKKIVKKRKLKIWNFFLTLFVLAGLSFVVYYCFQIPVANLIVEGTKYLNDDDVLEINFSGNYSENMVFYIPLPTGEIDGFKIYFYDSSYVELFSKSTAKSFTVGRNKMIIAPDF